MQGKRPVCLGDLLRYLFNDGGVLVIESLVYGVLTFKLE